MKLATVGIRNYSASEPAASEYQGISSLHNLYDNLIYQKIVTVTIK